MVDPPRRLAAALTGLGVGLCVLGWYQASGQPTVAQQIPYLASATIPGAALLAAGAAALLRPSGRTDGVSGRAGWAARTVGFGRRRNEEERAGAGLGAAPGSRSGFFRIPDGRYLHTPDCPLLDARADAIALSPAEAADCEPLPCPLCHATVPGGDSSAGSSADSPSDPSVDPGGGH